MSFYCPWQDGQFETCRRTGGEACVPGKPGCVLFGKVAFIEDIPERKRPPRKRAATKPSPPRKDEPALTREVLIRQFEEYPGRLREALRGRTDWTSPLTPGGWSASQVVHHLADVHASGSARVRRALCEALPRVERYGHEEWARLPDANDPALVASSLSILEGVHARWAALLKGLDPSQWKRAYEHPDAGAPISVEEDLAWHVKHGEIHLRRLG